MQLFELIGKESSTPHATAGLQPGQESLHGILLWGAELFYEKLLPVPLFLYIRFFTHMISTRTTSEILAL